MLVYSLSHFSNSFDINTILNSYERVDSLNEIEPRTFVGDIVF